MPKKARILHYIDMINAGRSISRGSLEITHRSNELTALASSVTTVVTGMISAAENCLNIRWSLPFTNQSPLNPFHFACSSVETTRFLWSSLFGPTTASFFRLTVRHQRFSGHPGASTGVTESQGSIRRDSTLRSMLGLPAENVGKAKQATDPAEH